MPLSIGALIGFVILFNILTWFFHAVLGGTLRTRLIAIHLDFRRPWQFSCPLSPASTRPDGLSATLDVCMMENCKGQGPRCVIRGLTRSL